MKLVIATAAFVLTAASAAFAGQDYASDTISTRNVPAAAYQDPQEQGQYPADVLSVTVGKEAIVAGSDYLTSRDKGLYQDEAVSVYTFASAETREIGGRR